MRDLSRWMLYRWWMLVILAVIWALGCTRIFFDPTPHVPLLFNWTPSLPYTVAWFEGRRAPLHRGDFVIYRFDGPGQQHYPGLAHQPFFKRIRGLPGDEVTVQGRTVSINGSAVAVAKTHAFDRRPLTPLAPTVIPGGHYYVEGTAADSFDSRYRESGLVRADQILGTVIPLL